MKLFLSLLFSLSLAAPSAAVAQERSLYPKVVDTTYATPATIRYFDAFFSAKSRHDVAATMQYFSPNMASYTDVTLGWDLAGYGAVEATFATYMPNWGEGRSYPTRILGDVAGGNGSALVAFTDTPELFGGELRLLGAVDVRDGKIVRWTDYWDSTGLTDTLYASLTASGDKSLTSYGEDQVGVAASEEVRRVSGQLSRALAAGDAVAAADLFTYDAVFEDMSLRAQVLGRASIERYLGRVLATAPFGARSTLRHIVGGDKGGGFEWRAAPDAGVKSGITALALNGSGRIVRATTVYDGRLLPDEARRALVAAVLEP